MRSYLEEALLNVFGEKHLSLIQGTRVGVAGLGGLGSNCALHLVRCGFRKFTLCDFDKVEAKNLNRQFYFADQLGQLKTRSLQENLLRINPNLDCRLVEEELTRSNIQEAFCDCDVIVEGFDRAVCKRMIAEHWSQRGKFFVSASGLAGWGGADEIVTRKIHDHFYLVGDLRREVSELEPPCSPRVNVAAAKQADCVLAWVLKDRQGGIL